jgi:hypothetical protein
MSINPFEAFGVNANDVDENVFRIPRDKYNVVLQEAGLKEYKDIPYFELVWAVDPKQDNPAKAAHSGKTAKDMYRLTPWTPADADDWKTRNARTISSYKKALLDLGVPANMIQQFNPEVHGPKLVGLRGTAIMGPQKNNPEFNAISNFTRANSSASGTSPAAPAAVAPVEQESAEKVDDLLTDWA